MLASLPNKANSADLLRRRLICAVRHMNRKIIKSTPFGSVDVIWTGLNDNPKIVRILLSKPGLSAEDQVSELYPKSQAFSCVEIEDIATEIKGLLEGDEVEFSLDVADLSLCTENNRGRSCRTCIANAISARTYYREV